MAKPCVDEELKCELPNKCIYRMFRLDVNSDPKRTEVLQSGLVAVHYPRLKRLLFHNIPEGGKPKAVVVDWRDKIRSVRIEDPREVVTLYGKSRYRGSHESYPDHLERTGCFDVTIGDVKSIKVELTPEHALADPN